MRVGDLLHPYPDIACAFGFQEPFAPNLFLGHAVVAAVDQPIAIRKGF
jgi:hypothetical protein